MTLSMIGKRHSIILVLLFVLVHCLLFWHYGVRTFYDSAAYLEAADYVIAHGKLQDFHHLFYTVPILIMSAFRLLFPGQVLPILLFQCFLSGLAVIALYKSAEKVFSSKTAGLMAGVIFLAWLDNIHWNITTMTESISCSIFFLVLYRLVSWQNLRTDVLVLTALLIVVFFTRPTGIVIILSSLIFVVAYYWKRLVESRLILVSITVITAVMIVFIAERMLDHWDFSDEYLKGNIITYADIVKDGHSLYHESLTIDPPSSRAFSASDSPIGRVVLFIYENPMHFLKTAGLKIFYLVSFVRPYYSWSHNLYLTVWIPLVYFLFAVGWRATSDLPIKLFVLTAIVLNCSLIGISSVDWDNRFYIPMEPGIVLLAGGGAAALITAYKHRVSKVIKRHMHHSVN
jgi:hypothetical protein